MFLSARAFTTTRLSRQSFRSLRYTSGNQWLRPHSGGPSRSSLSSILLATTARWGSNNNDTDTTTTAAAPAKRKLRKTQLKSDLKQYRTQQAEGTGKPPYTVFTNAALEEIYATLPTTSEELLQVKGIGPKKLDMFGPDILAIVSQYTDVNGQSRSISATESLGQSSFAVVPRPAMVDPKSLTLEQKHASNLILSPERPNVFVSGSAGTGKSYVLKYVVQELEKKRRPSPPTISNTEEDGIITEEEDASMAITSRLRVGVCAPTGVAAIHVGGSTLHSFFGIGLGTGSMNKLVQKVTSNTEAQKRIDETDTLIIDECSMLSSDLLETLDTVVRLVRQEGKYADLAFGGMQVICFGDFFQLPPIARGPEKPFCFESSVWQELGLSDNMVELEQVQRQDHRDFVELLNRIRIGQFSYGDVQGLNARCVISDKHPLPTDGIVPTRLYSLNKDVDTENEARLSELEGKEIICSATNTWKENMPVGTLAMVKKSMMESLKKEMPDEVRLKIGAQVMLTRNKDLDRSLVNGSRGVVIRFERSKDGEMTIPVVRFDSGVVTPIAPVEAVRYNPDGGPGCLSRFQVPLKLAWAVTVHKSQGTTLTRALLDISSAFEYGQCYVALSRVRSLEGLWLVKPARPHNIKVSPQVLDFYNKRIQP